MRKGFRKLIFSKFMPQRQRPVAVGLHDGYRWHCCVFFYKGGGWQCTEQITQEGSVALQIPPQLLQWAASNGARRMRVLIPNEPHEVEMSLPDDIEAHEAQAAISHEMASRVGDEGVPVRVAMARADRFQMGGGSSKILASVFDDDVLLALRGACAKHKVSFEGLGSLELALLNYHARLSNQVRCLLLLPHACFYAAPASQGQPFTFFSMPVTLGTEERTRNEDRYERLARRFQTHRHQPLIVWSPRPAGLQQIALIKDLFGEQTEISWADLNEHVEGITRHAAWSRQIGHMFNGTAFVGMSERLKDPHRAGTWLCLLFLAGSVGGMSWQVMKAHDSLLAAEQRASQWKKLVAERDCLQREAESQRAERNQQQAITQLLRDVRTLPPGLWEVLDILRKEMPAYTRLVSIFQAQPEAGEDKKVCAETNTHSDLILQGTTFSQEAIPQLSKILSQAAKNTGLEITQHRIERLDQSQGLFFEFQLSLRLDSK